MNAAIYARVSRDDKTSEDEAESVRRQVMGAKAFIASKAKDGWTLNERHVYMDSGVSGALFADREQFQRMMRDAEARAFASVVLFDLDRFGRNAHKSMVALHALTDLGITIWDFSTGVAVDLKSFEGRVTANLKAEFAQNFQEKIRKHTKSAMRKKAEEGFATGGKVFGYDNHRIAKGQVERRINEAEAEVIRDIYRQFADGVGARSIAGTLNRAGVPKPRAQQGKRDGWSVSTIRAVLNRPLYRGEIVYGLTMKAYDHELREKYRNTTREKGQIPMPEGSEFRSEKFAGRLRIVDSKLAERVDERLQELRGRYLASVAKGDGTAPHKTHGKFLLSGGMLLCPTCGGHFEARKYPFRGKPSPPMYMCATRRRKPGVCTNTLALPIEDTDDTVLSIIEGEVLGSRFIRELLALVDQGEADNSAHLTADRDRLRVEVDNLVKSIAAGVPADTVAPAIREREGDIARLEIKLAAPRPAPPNMARLRAALEQRAAEWKSDLRAEPQVARQVLRRMVGPLTLWDESTRPKWIRFETTPTAELLSGLAPALLLASPRGADRILRHDFLIEIDAA